VLPAGCSLAVWLYVDILSGHRLGEPVDKLMEHPLNLQMHGDTFRSAM